MIKKVKPKNIKTILIRSGIIGLLILGGIYLNHAYRFSLIQKPAYFEKKTETIPVLGYHHVLTVEEKEKHFPDNEWIIDTEMLEKHFKYLKKNQYNTLTLKEFKRKYELGKADPKDVLLTFDDGYKSVIRYVKPLLEKYDMKATCFVIGSKVAAGEESWDASKFSNISRKDIEPPKNLEYQAHTYDLHFHIKGQAALEVKNETEILADLVKEKSVVPCEFFAYPYGISSPQAIAALKKSGCLMAFSFANERPVKLGEEDIYRLPRFAIKSGDSFAKFKKIVN